MMVLNDRFHWTFDVRWKVILQPKDRLIMGKKKREKKGKNVKEKKSTNTQVNENNREEETN